MATLSRKFLSTLGIEEDKADAILETHSEVLNEVKAERDKYKEEAEKLPGVQKQLSELQAQIEGNEKDPFKVKYEAIKEEFEQYKKGIDEKALQAKKEGAYRDLLKAAGVNEKRIDAVLKVSDINSIEFDDDGKVKGADELTANIKTEWADFITTQGVKGAQTSNPPANNGKTTMTREQIRAINDPSARQKAMIENASLFPELSGITQTE